MSGGYDQVIAETKQHQDLVKQFMKKISSALEGRAEHHDDSKLCSPEIDVFKDCLSKPLSALKFNSEEYNEFLVQLAPALTHHYANNRHHPEHFPNGIPGMNIIDLVEMICDWKASSMRHNDGNILNSIAESKERFHMSDELVSILRNTAELLEL
jgi:hypothetical protein